MKYRTLKSLLSFGHPGQELTSFLVQSRVRFCIKCLPTQTQMGNGSANGNVWGTGNVCRSLSVISGHFQRSCASFLLERMFPSNPNHNVNMCAETFDQTFASAVKCKQVLKLNCLPLSQGCSKTTCRQIETARNRPPSCVYRTHLNWVDFYRCHIYDIIGIGQY